MRKHLVERLEGSVTATATPSAPPSTWQPASPRELLLALRPKLLALAQGALAGDRTGKDHALLVVAQESPWVSILEPLAPAAVLTALWDSADGYPVITWLSPLAKLLPELTKMKPRKLARNLAAQLSRDPGLGRFHAVVLHHEGMGVGQVVVYANAMN